MQGRGDRGGFVGGRGGFKDGRQNSGGGRFRGRAFERGNNVWQRIDLRKSSEADRKSTFEEADPVQRRGRSRSRKEEECRHKQENTSRWAHREEMRERRTEGDVSSDLKKDGVPPHGHGDRAQERGMFRSMRLPIPGREEHGN
jgi:hypothetical protein